MLRMRMKNQLIFQSTLPREERHSGDGTGFIDYGISIHAPTRGATRNTHQFLKVTVYFNPRSHERSD